MIFKNNEIYNMIEKKAQLKVNGNIILNENFLSFFKVNKSVVTFLQLVSQLELKYGQKFLAYRWPASMYEEGYMYTNIVAECSGKVLGQYTNYATLVLYPLYNKELFEMNVKIKNPLIWMWNFDEISIRKFFIDSKLSEFDLLKQLSISDIKSLITNNQNENSIIDFFDSNKHYFDIMPMREEAFREKLLILKSTKSSKEMCNITYQNKNYTRINLLIPTLLSSRAAQEFGYYEIPISFYNFNSNNVNVGRLGGHPLKDVLKQMGYKVSIHMDDLDFLITSSLVDLNLLANFLDENSI